MHLFFPQLTWHKAISETTHNWKTGINCILPSWNVFAYENDKKRTEVTMVIKQQWNTGVLRVNKNKTSQTFVYSRCATVSACTPPPPTPIHIITRNPAWFSTSTSTQSRDRLKSFPQKIRKKYVFSILGFIRPLTYLFRWKHYNSSVTMEMVVLRN